MSEQKQLERVAEIESQTALAGKFGIRFGIQTSDVAYLLAELRKRDEALARVEAEVSATEELAEIVIGEDLQAGLRMVARGIRAAVTGDGA